MGPQQQVGELYATQQPENLLIILVAILAGWRPVLRPASATNKPVWLSWSLWHEQDSQTKDMRKPCAVKRIKPLTEQMEFPPIAESWFLSSWRLRPMVVKFVFSVRETPVHKITQKLISTSREHWVAPMFVTFEWRRCIKGTFRFTHMGGEIKHQAACLILLWQQQNISIQLWFGLIFHIQLPLVRFTNKFVNLDLTSWVSVSSSCCEKRPCFNESERTTKSQWEPVLRQHRTPRWEAACGAWHSGIHVEMTDFRLLCAALWRKQANLFLSSREINNRYLFLSGE